MDKLSVELLSEQFIRLFPLVHTDNASILTNFPFHTDYTPFLK